MSYNNLEPKSLGHMLDDVPQISVRFGCKEANKKNYDAFVTEQPYETRRVKSP